MNEWINIKNTLPELKKRFITDCSEPVLIRMKDGEIKKAVLVESDPRWVFDYDVSCSIKDAPHWMPLPSSPPND